VGYFARLAARETEASAVSEISKKVLMTSTIREEHYITFPLPWLERAKILCERERCLLIRYKVSASMAAPHPVPGQERAGQVRTRSRHREHLHSRLFRKAARA